MSALLLGTALVKGSEDVDKYKEDAAASVLETVKKELGADAIYNNSTLTSSNSANIEYVVVKKGDRYVFRAVVKDGKTTVLENDGIDEQTRKAINTVARAQDGSFGDARRAKKLVKKIEEGAVNLSVDNEDYLSKWWNGNWVIKYKKTQLLY